MLDAFCFKDGQLYLFFSGQDNIAKCIRQRLVFALLAPPRYWNLLFPSGGGCFNAIEYPDPPPFQ